MKCKILLVILLLPLLWGCDRKAGMVEFVEVSESHKILTNETCGALIASIHDDIVRMEAEGNLTPNEKRSAFELIERLEMIVRQSDIMYRYVIVTQVDQQLIAEMIRNKWKGENP